MNFADVIKKLLSKHKSDTPNAVSEPASEAETETPDATDTAESTDVPESDEIKSNITEANTDEVSAEPAAEAVVSSAAESVDTTVEAVDTAVEAVDTAVAPADETVTAANDPDFDPFTESLDILTADDIAPEAEKKKLSGSELVSEIVRKCVLVACVGVFVWSAGTLVQSFVDYQRGEELYSGVSDSIFDTNLGGEHKLALSTKTRQSQTLPDYATRLSADYEEIEADFTQTTYNVKFEQMKSNLTYLQTVNPDIFGYIHIDGTNISYPVVLGSDNDYYLDHAYTGDYMVCGSIFADYNNFTNMEWNYNTVLYGHNMNNGTMFNNVTMFLEEEVFNSKQIELYTLDGIYTFEPFAIYRAHETYHYFNTYFNSDAEFVDFCYEMQSNSNFNKELDFEEGDQILTLSTCYNDLRTVYRYALQSKLVKVER